MNRHPAPRFARAIPILLALTLLHPRPTSAATPETVSLTPGSGTVHWQTAMIGGATTAPESCTEDVTCDSVVVTLQPGDYTGLQLSVAIDWLVPASDFDLYIYEDHIGGALVGSSTGGAPETHEGSPVALAANLAAPRRLAIRVVSFAAAPENVQGTLTISAAPTPRTATFVSPSGITFSHSVTVSAPTATRDCEPSLRVDVRGNAYVGGIRGFPGGVDMWRFDLDPTSSTYDPQLQTPIYIGQPDNAAPTDTFPGRDGGGDIDFATSVPLSPATVPVLTVVSLMEPSMSSAVSTDRGGHFVVNPAGGAVPAQDRQWIAAQGADTVYVLYRAPIPSTALWVERSTDHGQTYPISSFITLGSTPGSIDVDRRNGWVYVSSMSSNAVFVSRSQDGGLTWQTFTADNSTSHAHLFDPLKVADDGTLYVTWTDGHAVWLTHSTDAGEHWAAPVQVSTPESHITLFAWLATGSAGRVAVVWYASTSDANTDASDWRVEMALITNATAASPTVRVAEVSDHVIHSSNLSEGGLTIPVVQAAPNRNLCDYFQVAVDPLGACVVAFSDDHNDYDGMTWLARQLSGPSLYAAANGGTGVLAPHPPTPPVPPGHPQIVDFAQDATDANLQVVPANNPFDITAIDYRCATQGGAALLEVGMKVSQLAPLPPNGIWRVNFAANAPGVAADRGDQFFLQAATPNGTPTYTFGSAARDTSGAMNYATLGNATGLFDSTNNEVVMRLPLASLDPYLTHGGPVRPGSVLVGLRGQTGTSGTATVRDVTRGSDGPFAVCSEVLDVGPAADLEFGMSPPVPNPGRDGAVVTLSIPVAARVQLAVFDAAGRLVRRIHDGVLPPGTIRMAWNGRDEFGRPAASGAYFMRLVAGGRTRSQHLVLLR
jgi:hypothetical protein